MTTETDNYQELVKRARQSNARPEDWFFEYAADVLHAIDALIKERDGAINRIDVLEQRASDWLERANSKYDTLARENERLREAMEIAWGIIANASGGDWDRERPEWKAAAIRWRDEHWHPSLDRARTALANAPTPNDKLDWDSCQHEWRARVDSQYHSETNLDVVCTKCQCPGDQNVKTGEVFWPAT